MVLVVVVVSVVTVAEVCAFWRCRNSFAACLSFWVSLEVESRSLDRYARTCRNQVVQAFACFFLHFCVPPLIEIHEARSFVISPVQCAEITPLESCSRLQLRTIVHFWCEGSFGATKDL